MIQDGRGEFDMLCDRAEVLVIFANVADEGVQCFGEFGASARYG